MSDIAIRVEGLGKRYRIGERERYKALRDVITDGVAAPFRKLRNAVSARRTAASSSAVNPNNQMKNERQKLAACDSFSGESSSFSDEPKQPHA
jgi:hypothetical protein